MNISPLHVISWVHHQRNVAVQVPYTVPTIQLCGNGSADHYLMVNDNEAAIMAGFKPDEKFMYTKCLSNLKHGISACSTELQQLVQLALNGFNAAAMMLSVGAVDSSKLRKDMTYQLINLLDVELSKQNIERQRRNKAKIQLEYAYIGVVDNFCYDLRKGQRIENAELLSKGLEPWMNRVKQADKIWEKVRAGSSIPFILQLRLTDESKFLGNLMLVDLLHPEFEKPIVAKPASSIYHSFTQLRRTVVRAVHSSDFSDPFFLDLNSCVLTRLLAEYLVGLGRTTVVMHVNESLYYNMEETLHALRFARFLQTIQCLVVQNKPDFRAEYYRRCLFDILLKYKSDKTEYIQCKEKLAQRQEELKRLELQMEDQKKAIERLTLECSLLRKSSLHIVEPAAKVGQKEEHVNTALKGKQKEKEEPQHGASSKDDPPHDPHDNTNAIDSAHDDPVAIDHLHRKYRISNAAFQAIKHEDQLRQLRIQLLAIEGHKHRFEQTSEPSASTDQDQKNAPIPLEEYDTRSVLSAEDTQAICNEMNRVITGQMRENELAQEHYRNNTKKLQIELDKARREAKHCKELSLEKKDMQKKLQEQDLKSQLLTNELNILKEQLALCNRGIPDHTKQATETHWKENIEWDKPQTLTIYDPNSIHAYIDKIHAPPPDEDDEMGYPEQPQRPFALKKGQLDYDLTDDEDVVMQSSSFANTSQPASRILTVQKTGSAQRTPPPSIDPRSVKRTKLFSTDGPPMTRERDRGPRVDVFVDAHEAPETSARRKKEEDDDDDDERDPLQVISENPQGPQKRRRVKSNKK